MGKLSCVAALALFSTTALSAMPALAASGETDAEAAPAAADDGSGSGNDIIVTARRRNGRIQDVPLPLTPSAANSSRRPEPTTCATYNDGLEPAVGVYVDQIFLARPGQAVFDLSDVERIEVLRAPQGTLFGKNTSAGAVIVVVHLRS